MSQATCICLLLYVCRVFATVDPSLSILESRIIALEKRDQLLTQIIQDQATKIDDLTTTVKFLDDQNTEKGQVINDIQKELETIKQTLHKPDTKQFSESTEHEHPFNASGHEAEAVKHDGHHQIDPLSSMHTKQNQHQIAPSPFINSERTRKYLLNGAETVAFHATFTGSTVQHHAVGTPIAFTNVLLNLGGGYHSSTSLFIASMSGIYIFSASIMSSLSDIGHEVHVGIMKNKVYLAGVYANRDSVSGGEQGSVTIATQLSIGDEVWVQHIVHDDSTLFGAGLTSFMGCLITPM